MRHSKKITIYLVIITISWLLVHKDLLSQTDSLENKDTLIIGGVYIVTLDNNKEILGELQSFDSLSISILSKDNLFNIKQEQIKSIEIPEMDYFTKPSLSDFQEWDSYSSICVTGGWIFPIGDSFNKNHGFSGSIGSDLVYHIKPYWAIYGNITYNFLSHKEPDYYYGYDTPDISGGCLEITIGTRSYFSQKKVRIFIEAGLGIYSYNVDSYYHGYSYYNESYNSLGINLGFGTDIILSKKISLVPKIKYHVIFSDVDSFTGIYAGINYNLK